MVAVGVSVGRGVGVAVGSGVSVGVAVLVGSEVEVGTGVSVGSGISGVLEPHAVRTITPIRRTSAYFIIYPRLILWIFLTLL